MIKTIRELNRHYYISIVVAAILFLLVFFNPGGFIPQSLSVGLTAEMYAIGITLLLIPAALKLFADRIKKIPEGTGKNLAVKRYKNAWLLRMYMVNAAVAGNMALYALSQNRNFMWLAVVSFMVYMFCKPSYQELETVVRKSEEVK